MDAETVVDGLVGGPVVVPKVSPERSIVEGNVELSHPVTSGLMQRSKLRKRPKKRAEYAVVLYNDDKHTASYIVDVLQNVCQQSSRQATELVERIHSVGQAVVWTGGLEVAELKRDQIRGFGPDTYADRPVRFPLGVMIEPVNLD